MRSIICLIVLVLPGFVSAQTCGDVNGISPVNLFDVTYLYSYLTRPSPPAPVGNADVDGRVGVTIADLVRLYNSEVWSDTLDCSGSGNYSFGAAPADTVFFPYMQDIPDHINSVVLSVNYSFTSNIEAAYFPILQRGGTATSNFRLSHITDAPVTTFISSARSVQYWEDTVVGTYAGDLSLTGAGKWLQLTYVRTSPGPGEIRPMPIDRNSLWRYSVQRDSDLVIPDVTFYEVSVPPDTLFCPEGTLYISEYAGDNTYSRSLTFTSSFQPLQFRLKTTSNWIVLPVSGWITTPSDAMVSINPYIMPPGVYWGVVVVEAADTSVFVTHDSIPVNYRVIEKPHVQNGDLDCDGTIDLVDLSRMIAYLTAFAGLPQNCF